MVNSERTADAGAFPKVILLDTTNMCNLKCSMCPHKVMTRKQGKMDMGLYRRLIDEIAEKDRHARVWMSFFGESLILRHQLFWQILYAKHKDLTDVVLNSNGTLLDDENCRGLVESGLDAIYIGIDAATAETYSKLRVGGDFNRTVANVNRLIIIRDRLKATTPRVVVQFVQMRENEHEIADFKAYWIEHGADVKIRPKVTWAGTVDPYKVCAVDRHPCYWAMRTMNVCWDGRIVLCSVDYDAKFVAGDVNSATLESIWNGPLKKVRTMQELGKYEQLPELCHNCTDWQMAKAEYYQ